MSDVQPKPDYVDLPDDKNWEDLTPYQRYYYKNRQEEIDRTQGRREELREWLSSYKDGVSCSLCGEERNPCLDFHHRDKDEKSMEVSSMPNQGYGKEAIVEEIEKCDIICANCHRVEHSTESFI
jgi:hypothetical protein